MQLKRWGSNRNSGVTLVFDKKPAVAWSASKSQLNLSVRRVSQGDQGQYDFSIGLTLEDVQQILEALSKECSLPPLAKGLEPSIRDLVRLQAAAAGMLPAEQ